MTAYLRNFKTGDCSRCPRKKTPGKKRGKVFLCLGCCSTEDTAKYMANAKDKKVEKAALVLTVSLPNDFSGDQNQWYDMVATFIAANPYCENCGEPIPPKYYRSASAHIVAKSLFPSVSTHPLNFLILGAGCGCHGEWDSSIENAAKMNCWFKGSSRFIIFEKNIIEKHKTLHLFKSLIPEILNKK